MCLLRFCIVLFVWCLSLSQKSGSFDWTYILSRCSQYTPNNADAFFEVKRLVSDKRHLNKPATDMRYTFSFRILWVLGSEHEDNGMGTTKIRKIALLLYLRIISMSSSSQNICNVKNVFHLRLFLVLNE